MINNIYSSLMYQELCEASMVEVIQYKLFGGIEKQNHIFGLRKDCVDYYGIYAPFWIPNFVIQYSDFNKLETSLIELINRTKDARQTKKIVIRLPPYFYSKSIEILSFILEKNGFTITNNALWQMIDLKGYESKLCYEASLKHSARKVLKKVNPQNIIFKEIEKVNHNEIILAHDLINQNRKSLGTEMKYSSSYLIDLMSNFEDQVKIFSIKIDSRLVAAAICHKTKENILYVASWGDYGHSLEYSPMYKFASELVGYCLENNFDYLDFGVSSDKDNLNLNLLKFKQNIGCETTLQKTYALDF